MEDSVVVIKDEEHLVEQEIYEFGLSMLKTSIIGIVIALFMCIIMDELLYGLLIVLFLLPLRQNAGGFHLYSKYLCLLVSFMLYYYLLIVDRHITSKKDKINHGYGLENVKRVVEKYSGSMSMSIADNIFTVEIVMFMN